ncbi:MAG TPA: PhnD/SsuA/transferrin family substrate-binding protein [Gemmataceae bacterium]|nr:PhnD/SsuA/transferrin family substrate-binding protein [Gemmataceae bacterium]
MRKLRWIAWSAAALVAAAILLLPAGRAEEGDIRSIRIGLVRTLFRDTPPSLVQVLSQPLKALMQSQTGMTGELSIAGDAFALSKKLKENKVQLGVFHGFEFAWARQKNPGLRPLVVVVSHHRQLHAHLIVRKDSSASGCGGLKGKVLAIPQGSREHCHLYLERRCPGGGVDPKSFFSEITRPASTEDALDDVIDGTVQAAIVDRFALDQYQQDKPNRCNRLRVLHQSEMFPTGVVAYQAGALDEGTLRRFHDGMIGANKSERGKELLKMCRITSFEEVPADYEQMLEDIAKAYPPPPRGEK